MDIRQPNSVYTVLINNTMYRQPDKPKIQMQWVSCFMMHVVNSEFIRKKKNTV